jgi:hypothetical protein
LIEGSLGRSAGLDAIWRKENLVVLPGIEFSFSIFYSIAKLLTDRAISAVVKFEIYHVMTPKYEYNITRKI